MSPRSKEKFGEIRERKRRQILDAAVDCFGTTGYHAVTISDLAKHAGISKGLMYNYFSSKEELLKTIFNEIMVEMMDLFNPENSSEINKKTFFEYFDRFINHLQSNLRVWKMYTSIFSQPAVQQILFSEIQSASRKPIEMIESYFQREGYKQPFVEVAFLSTLVSGVTAEYIADPENFPILQIKERILRLYQ